MASTYQGPADKLELYEAVVSSHDQAERKGATMPYTSLNGHMFSFLDATGTLLLRLSPEDRETFLKKYDSTIAEQHGRQMKEFVVAPDAFLGKTREVGEWFDRSYRWVGTLKPKPSKRA